MNRPLKFRAWNSKSKQMVYKVNIDYNGHANDGQSYITYGPPDAVMQFTGMKDKRGKDLYEGDIIQHFITGYIFSIVYKDGAFCLKAENDHPNKGVFFGLNTLDNMEIKGNIFQNPEILK